ncbi:MAG: acyltransferase family protein [Solirubrobacterales bacterium]
MREERNRALDGLRGLAALSVLTFHVWDYARPVPHVVFGSPADYALNEGRLGLILFFVLSGFLLYGPWARAALSGADPPELRDYLTRRLARIAPAYYLALLGSVALLWGASGTPGVHLPPASELPLFAVFCQNYSSSTVLSLDPPTWTLAVEASFYLALPAIGVAAVALGRSRGRQLLLPVVVICAGLVWNAFTGPASVLEKALPAALPYFGFGMLAAAWLHGRRLRGRGAMWLMLAGIAAVIVDAGIHSGLCPTAIEPLVSQTLRDLPAAAGFAAIVAAAQGAGPRSLLGWRPLVALGTVSYGVYLWHLPLLLALRSAGALPLGLVPALAVVLPASVAVATLSWFGVERPALRWARLACRRRRALPQAAQRRPSTGRALG